MKIFAENSPGNDGIIGIWFDDDIIGASMSLAGAKMEAIGTVAQWIMAGERVPAGIGSAIRAVSL